MKTISEIAAAYTKVDTSVDYDKMTKVELIALIHNLSSKVATGKTVNDLVIEMLKDETLAENPQSIADFKAGKDRALGFMVGQIMKKSRGKANPAMVNEMLLKKLKE